ncbi:hypothetical protein [Marinilabilia salmonicolor]|uniref:hypothetical protein n=1 Tax=Marinilabilia salmonicolor TaxID=989 RepID=UPI0011DF790E|nr:hypothetical protein [Marinilabilia salmonicolor]
MKRTFSTIKERYLNKTRPPMLKTCPPIKIFFRFFEFFSLLTIKAIQKLTNEKRIAYTRKEGEKNAINSKLANNNMALLIFKGEKKKIKNNAVKNNKNSSEAKNIENF